MASAQDKETSKLAYEKPRLRTIELAAEEIMAVGCKTVDGGFAPAATPCSVGGCSLPGS